MSKIKIVIFDCDGVLFDTKPANKAYYNHLLTKFGYPVMTEEDLSYVQSHHVHDSIRHIFRLYQVDIDAVYRYREDLDYCQFISYMIMAPDLMKFLNKIRPNYKIAISTNRTNTMALILRTFGLEPFFDLVITPLNIGRPKPDPEALLKILSHFNLEVEEGIFVGDSNIDQEHAAGIGMTFIAYNNPSLSAHYHVRNFTEIIKLPIF